jgi:hypothetical protein
VEEAGALTAFTLVLTVGDPYRFEKSRSVGAYLGLFPARDQSGERDPQRRISKEGDETLSLGSRLATPTTSSVRSDRTRTSGATARRSPPGAARTPRSRRRWPQRGSSRCSCTARGLQERPTIRFTTSIGAKSRRRQLKERRWSTTKHKGGEVTAIERRGDPKVADDHG